MDRANGCDSSSVKIFKTCGDSIAFPLKLMFESTIHESVFPYDWKKSNVFPIPKKGSKNFIKNFWPINLHPIFSIFFERLVFNSNKAGLFEGSFSWEGGGGGGFNLNPSSYLKKNLSNFNETLNNC